MSDVQYYHQRALSTLMLFLVLLSPTLAPYPGSTFAPPLYKTMLDTIDSYMHVHFCSKLCDTYLIERPFGFLSAYQCTPL